MKNLSWNLFQMFRPRFHHLTRALSRLSPSLRLLAGLPLAGLLICLLISVACQHQDESIREESTGWRARVLNVIDGDTVVVLPLDKSRAEDDETARPSGPDRSGKDHSGKIRLRLYGIDAPETRQRYGHQSKNFLSSRLSRGQEVEIESLYTDQYGRTVAIVWSDEKHGKSLNEALVETGMAWVYPQHCVADFCEEWKADEEDARRQRIGLWGDRQDPIPPWQWRKKNQREK